LSPLPSLTCAEDLSLAAALAAISAGSLLTYAALSAGSQIFGHTIIAGDNPNQIALTYDDGPNTAATSELLDILARHNARATFFMIGRFVRQQPELARRVHAAGHLIGNHTETHPWLSFQSTHTIRHELRACNEALEDAIGAPVHYFRPPHGARRPAVFAAARELGLKLVQWNAMGHDWKPIGPDRIVDRLEHARHRAQRRRRGTNILLHDGHQGAMGTNRNDTLAATNVLLIRYQQEGAQLVTVDAWDDKTD
jgi:peptidoglycan/xylan/chitin deacetylase (PgdA/CDA1 family)